MSDDGKEEDEWLYGESVTVVSVTAGAPVEVKPEVDPETLPAVVAGVAEDTAEDGESNSEEADIALRPPQDILQEPVVTEGADGEEVTGSGRKRARGDEDGPEPDGEEPSNDKAGESDEDGDSDSEDEEEDSINVVIGEIKSSEGFPSKRPGGAPPDKKGKFSTEDFDSVGQINGVPAHEYSIDSIDEKPWRKPGADITDYFNYGFSEETWRSYCDRQRRLRYESGANAAVNAKGGNSQGSQGIPVAMSGDMGKYGGGSGPQNIQFPKKFGPQGQGMRKDGMMGMGMGPPPGMGMNMGMMPPPMGMRPDDLRRENTIQVMTADRREYSRKQYEMGMGPPPFDMSMPPPAFPHRDFMGPPPDFYNQPPEYYIEDDQPDYEEQQWMDSQWEMEELGRVGPASASSLVPLTKVAVVPPPPGDEDIAQSPPTATEDKKVLPEPK